VSSSGNPNLQGFPQNAAPVVDPARNFQWTTYWLRFMMALWQRTGAASGSGVVYTGIISAYGAATPPLGWLACDGSAIDRTVYSALFSIIGTTWGIGDGSTTFNIPNLIGKFPIGAGVIPIGNSGGAATVTLSIGNLPSHTHTITDPGHSHSTLAAASTSTAGAAAGDVTTGGTTGTSTTGITVNATGSGTPFSILPPYAAILWMIKT
jgi:microcystin-dependent protein